MTVIIIYFPLTWSSWQLRAIQNTDGPINVEVYPLIQQCMKAALVSSVSSSCATHDASKGLVARKTPLFSLLQFVHERGVTEKSGGAAMFVGRVMPFVFSFASNTPRKTQAYFRGLGTDWGQRYGCTPCTITDSTDGVKYSLRLSYNLTCT